MAEEQNSRPTIQLLTLEIPSLRYWARFGCLLGLPYEVVDAIQADCSTTTDCTLRVLSEWLNRTPHASWSEVAKCLRDIGQRTVAQCIERKYVPLLSKRACDSQNGQAQDVPGVKKSNFTRRVLWLMS